MERIRAVVIGGGQAGLAVSHELAERDVEHVLLEAGEVGQAWRTRRWRSFHLVSPNWLNRLPGYWYDGPAPDAFATRAEVLGYLEGYAVAFRAPVRTATAVTRVDEVEGLRVVRTTSGDIAADAVVVATGAFGKASMPTLAADLPPGIRSIHTDGYWAPEDLPPGGVLVIGSGQSGLQIAYELLAASRAVTLSVGRHGWVPRRVYGRDQNYWRLVNGDFASIVADVSDPRIEYPFTPLARWGVDDFNVRTVWQAGARLAGRLVAIDGGTARFAPGLPQLLGAGDEYARTFVARVRDFARGRGEDVPEPELESHWRPGEMPEALASLDLLGERIGTVIWSTGYRQDFSWIAVPGALAANGAPYQHQGVSPVPGISFVGLHRMWEAASGTILGCGWAALNVAEHIAAS